MSGGSPVMKKPKKEADEERERVDVAGLNTNNKISRSEQEEALVALIEHRVKEVDHLRQRISYYHSQLEQAETRLEDSQSKLARLRGNAIASSSKSSQRSGTKMVKVERRSSSPSQISEGSSHIKSQSKPQLVIPAAKPKSSQPVNVTGSGAKASNGSHSQPKMTVTNRTESPLRIKEEKFHIFSSERETHEKQAKRAKRKFEQKEHKELIRAISTCSYPKMIQCQTGSLISSQHKRKMRSLVLCPTIDHLFVTRDCVCGIDLDNIFLGYGLVFDTDFTIDDFTYAHYVDSSMGSGQSPLTIFSDALDGVLNLWEVQGRGSGAHLLSSTECLSPKQRRWPEDIAWHPDGSSIFSVYTADGGDSQISVLDLNKRKMGMRVQFLNEKPHFKGIINNIEFMPWENTCFVTGGSDHAVVLWSDKDDENSWKPKTLHRNLHSSAVMGVAGLQQKQMIISAGADKRIIGFDVATGRADYKHQIENKCMSVLPNPCDFNLFMVQTGTPEKQLRLFDIRLRQTELHAFGWKQESSESQSALINQAWSPDGFYLTSGSADPMIHIFDIRYIAHKPSQSIRAHQKRVFKAEWHHSLSLLISISSDLNVGLHKIV